MALAGILALLLGCDRKDEGPFQKRADGWYWKDKAMNLPPSRTVVRVSGDFAISGDDAFYRAARIDSADGSSFQALSDHYAKDRKAVYYADTYREGQEYYLVKHTRVRVIEGADPATFRYLDHGYGCDGSNAYFEGAPFPVADAATFEPLGYGHARDRVHGYYQQKPIEGSHGASFVALDDHYSKDSARVFYSDVDLRAEPGPKPIRSRAIAGAQPATFKVLSDDYAADAARAYYKGKPLQGAVPPLEVLEVGYAKTATHVFYFGTRVPDADAPTFKSDALGPTGIDASDARGDFYEGKRLAKSP